jgi:hypothetical protein
MTENGITPFANESDALTIGELNIENRTDQVTIYGSIDLTKDQEGLRRAVALKAVLDKIVDTLRADNLPDKLPTPAIETVKNPFSNG